MQAIINLQGEFWPKKNKRAGPNKAVQGGKFGKINKNTIVETQSLINVQGEFWPKKINVRVLMKADPETVGFGVMVREFQI